VNKTALQDIQRTLNVIRNRISAHGELSKVGSRVEACVKHQRCGVGEEDD